MTVNCSHPTYASARAVLQRVDAEPLWLNTAGAGVAWLHVRLDSRPKYYHHAPYTAFERHARQGVGLTRA